MINNKLSIYYFYINQINILYSSERTYLGNIRLSNDGVKILDLQNLPIFEKVSYDHFII